MNEESENTKNSKYVMWGKRDEKLGELLVASKKNKEKEKY
jgi:hypothetical protein